MLKTDQEFLNLVKAGIPVIQIISYEFLRAQSMLMYASKQLNRELFFWDIVDGIRKYDPGKKQYDVIQADPDPHLALDFFMGAGETGAGENEDKKDLILVLDDFHPNMVSANPGIVKKFRKIAQPANASADKTLILLQPLHDTREYRFPVELEKEVHVFTIPYPEYIDIAATYQKVRLMKDIPAANAPEEPPGDLISAALGLSTMEAEKAFSLAYIVHGRLTSAEIPFIIREKENVIRQSGYLEYYHPKENIEDIGGLDVLKNWLVKRGRGFEKKAEEFGLSFPRGILIMGIPGTGKSLTAKAIGNLWQFPLLRLDMGKVFAGFVGESERNIREALNIAEAIAPSILWIDEIEKGAAGISSSDKTDGGTSSRVLGTFLTWLQEKTKPVFVAATANRWWELPPELLRKGRVDEIFFTDLPTLRERQKIIEIHLKKKKRDPARFNVKLIAEKSNFFSGAEIEQAITEALFQAYADNERELTNEDITGALTNIYPLSRTMPEAIKKIREWAKNRAVPASSEEPEAAVPSGAGPRLKQEIIDPFEYTHQGGEDG
ncbi:MAG: AAA family ATPase [Treponema sp.]|jgi:hypothetical protein|nr:AAA family ATPase [Treponema sp.]